MDNKQIAKEVIEALGGRENVNSVAHCATRLRIVLKDNSLADLKKLENEIEEYIDLSKMIKSFNEWSEIFMKEVEFIQVFRNINDKDHDLYGSWRVRGNIEYKDKK